MEKDKNVFENEKLKNSETVLSSTEENREIVLADILDEEADSSKSTFKQYKNKAEIAGLICDDFTKEKYNNAHGFFLNDGNKTNIGIITQCHGLSTLAVLSAMGVDLAKYEKIFFDTLKDIFKRINYGESDLVFDASPYLKQESKDSDDSGTFIGDYTETIASVLSTMIEAREILYNGLNKKMFKDNSSSDIKVLIDQSEEVSQICIKKLNSAAIEMPKPMEYKICLLYTSPSPRDS